jgi:hypothetical protein
MPDRASEPLFNTIRHLTWRGRREMAWYSIRRLFVTPAPADERCIMGYPIGDHVRCPRRALGDSLWCQRHA